MQSGLQAVVAILADSGKIVPSVMRGLKSGFTLHKADIIMKVIIIILPYMSLSPHNLTEV